jgi:hypothetical protein
MYIVCVKCLEKIDIENKSNYVFNNKEYYHNNCFNELKKKSNFVKNLNPFPYKILFTKFSYLQDHSDDLTLTYQEINKYINYKKY